MSDEDEIRDEDFEFEDADAFDSKDVDSLAARVNAQGGLIETTLGALREELGYKKLGRWVLEEVEEYLTNQKLGFFPVWKLRPEANTEPRKEQRLWVYAHDGSSRAQIITAVLHPEDHDVFSALDGLAAGRHQALLPQQKLDLIREIANS